jgi:uncharacterized protein (DUF342 family)
MKIRVVTEDITRSRAPIRYDGNVEVIGTVRSGANLEIDGDLEVFGSVEDATINARGNVFIEAGFLGTGTGLITCGGDFEARFVQSQSVKAIGSVRISRSLVSSHVLSSRDVTVGSRNSGSIIGGQVNAYGKVEAAIVGSPRPVMTRINVGLDPVISERIAELENEAMDLTKKRIGFIKDLGSVLDADGADSSADPAIDLKAAADAIQADLTLVGTKIMELRKGSGSNPDGTVKVWQESYPPVEISICSSKILNDRWTGPVIFRLFENRVILDTWSMGNGGTT